MAGKGISLSGGLITNVDSEEIGEAYSSDLVNADFLKPGSVRLRKAIGNSFPSPARFDYIYKWVDKVQSVGKTELDPIWIGVCNSLEHSSGKDILYSSDNGYTWSWLWTFTTWNDIPKVVDLGGSLRFIAGYSVSPIFVDFINRGFFGKVSPSDLNARIEYQGIYVDPNNAPRPYWNITGVSAIAGGDLPDGSSSGDTMYYYYKIAPVFDGYQIGSLDKEKPHKISVGYNASAKSAQIVVNVDTNDWNPRITHLNIYRGARLNVDNADGATYYLIKSMRTTNTLEEVSETYDFAGSRRCASLGVSDLASEGVKGSDDAGEDGHWLVTGMRGVSSSHNFATGEMGSHVTRIVHNQSGGCKHLGFQYVYPGTDYYTMRFEENSNWNADTCTRQRTRGAGNFIRRIKTVKEDYVITHRPFWRKDPDPEWYDYGGNGHHEKANYRWTSGNNQNSYSAIVKNYNLCGYMRHAWSWSQYKENDSYDYVDNPDSFVFKHYNSFRVGVSDSDWDYITRYRAVSLTQGKWYWATFNMYDWYDTGNSTVGMRIMSGTNMGGTKLFEMSHNYAWHSNNKGSSYCGWYYHSASSGTYYVHVGNIATSGGGVASGSTDQFMINMPGLFECIIPPTTTSYFGSDVIGINKDLDGSGGSIVPGDTISLLNEPDEAIVVEDSLETTTSEMLLLEHDLTEHANTSLSLNSQYQVIDNTDGTIDLKFLDNGYPDGGVHVNQDTSTSIRYKTGQMVSSRFFVANVVLDPDGEAERHPNWIMFSDINNPDVIPITNYLAVSDLGEAEIVKLAELAGNLIVFSANAIWRLNVPSYDPMQWSLMEAVKNIGCASETGIISVKGAVYFCSPDNIYMMDANFVPTPISQSIQNIYQDLYNKHIKLHHDPLRNQLYVIFSNNEIYTLYMNRMPQEDMWIRQVFNTGFEQDNNPYSMALDEVGRTHLVFEDKVSMLEHNGQPEEDHNFLKSTGWMKFTSPDMPIIIRKLYIRYKSDVEIKLLFHTDHECIADDIRQEDKHNHYEEDIVITKGTRSSARAGQPYVLPINCDDEGKKLVGSKLNHTVRLGIRCFALKITAKTEDPAGYVEILNMELENE